MFQGGIWNLSVRSMKVTLYVLFSFSILTAYSQKDSVKRIKWAVGININTVEPATDFAIAQRIYLNGHRKDNSYCLGAMVSYTLKDNFHIRLSGKYTNNRVKETHDSREENGYAGGGYNLDTLGAQQSIFYLTPALLWSQQYKRLTFYGGFQIVYKYYSSISAYSNQWYYASAHAYDETIKYNFTEEGGFAIGPGALVGFGVNVWKLISLGAEFSSSYSYYQTGGKITTRKTLLKPDPSNNFYDSYSETQQTFKGYGFSNVVSSICLHITF
jgi:hypothetical protein